MGKLTKAQWEWLEAASRLPEGRAYSSDNEDHDALFDGGLIEAFPLNQIDWYGALVRVTDAGRAALAKKEA